MPFASFVVKSRRQPPKTHKIAQRPTISRRRRQSRANPPPRLSSRPFPVNTYPVRADVPRPQVRLTSDRFSVISLLTNSRPSRPWRSRRLGGCLALGPDNQVCQGGVHTLAQLAHFPFPAREPRTPPGKCAKIAKCAKTANQGAHTLAVLAALAAALRPPRSYPELRQPPGNLATLGGLGGLPRPDRRYHTLGASAPWRSGTELEGRRTWFLRES